MGQKKNTIMHSSNINSISHYFFIISSTFFLSIFICVTILLWKNCKSPLSSSPTKNNNTNTTKNSIDDPHHDYINIKSRNNNNYDNQSFISDVTCSRSEFIYSNNNNNINIDESYSTHMTAHTATNNRYSETLSSRQNKDNSKLGLHLAITKIIVNSEIEIAQP